MKRYGKWAVAAAVAMGLLFAAGRPADATPAYAKAEKKSCSFCHVGKTGDKVFTDAGKFYGRHHSLTGFAEEAKAPAKPAPAPVSVPAATAEAPLPVEDARMDKPMTDSGTPCGCDFESCMKKCGKRHGRMHGEGEMLPMTEKMKGHLEEMKKAVSDLRESEKKLEASTGSDPFRSAVLDHLKKLDDLQASHLGHMESMMGRMHGGKEGMGSGKDGRHGCREKHGCDCPCGGMKP